MIEAIAVACGGSLIAALVSLITLFVNRKWAKDDKTEEIVKKLGDIEKKLDSHIKENEQQFILQDRSRIISFADECSRKVEHSSESFDDILASIDNYEKYCKRNKDFANSKADISIDLIKTIYKKCQAENKFI